MKQRGRPKSGAPLTDREVEVLSLIREGRTNREIADELGISLAGAKFHVAEILSRLGVDSREEAAKWKPGSPILALSIFEWSKGHPALFAAGLSCFTVVGVFAMVAILSRVGPGDGPNGLSILPIPSLPAATEVPRSTSYGLLVSVSDNELLVQDLTSGKLASFRVDDKTTLTRPFEYEILTDADLSRLQLGDRLGIQMSPSGSSPNVKHIEVNAEKVLEILIDRMEVGSFAGLLNEGIPGTSSPVWNITVTVKYSSIAQDISGRRLDAYATGERVMVHGYIADDGTILVP